jgi:hypothetical protein
MTLLTRSQVLLDLTAEEGVYSYEEEGDSPVTVKLSEDRWEELGKPTEITVTIEPGDTLN